MTQVTVITNNTDSVSAGTKLSDNQTINPLLCRQIKSGQTTLAQADKINQTVLRLVRDETL